MLLTLVENNGQSSGLTSRMLYYTLYIFILHQVEIGCRDLHIGNGGWWGRFKFRGPAQITCSYPTEGLTCTEYRMVYVSYLTLGQEDGGEGSRPLGVKLGVVIRD